MFITVSCCERDIETPKISNTWLEAQTRMAEDIAKTYELDVGAVLTEIVAADADGEEHEWPDEDLVISGDSAYGELSHNNLDWKIFEIADAKPCTNSNTGSGADSGESSGKNPDKTEGLTEEKIDEMKSLLRDYCHHSANVNNCDPDKQCEFCPIQQAYDLIAEGVPVDPEDDEPDDEDDD